MLPVDLLERGVKRLSLHERRRRPGDSGPIPRRARRLAIPLDVRIAGGQQLLAVEDRVGAGQEAERLQLIAHSLPAR